MSPQGIIVTIARDLGFDARRALTGRASRCAALHVQRHAHLPLEKPLLLAVVHHATRDRGNRHCAAATAADAIGMSMSCPPYRPTTGFAYRAKAIVDGPRAVGRAHRTQRVIQATGIRSAAGNRSVKPLPRPVHRPRAAYRLAARRAASQWTSQDRRRPVRHLMRSRRPAESFRPGIVHLRASSVLSM